MSTRIIRLLSSINVAKPIVALFFLSLSINSELAAQNFWKPTNGPYGGNVSALAINASGHIFAGTNGNLFEGIIGLIGGNFFAEIDGIGVFRSTDNGGSWTEVNTGLTSTNVNTLVINSRGDIFAGMDKGGIFRSTNNGDSWTAVITGLTSTSVYALAINSNGDIFAVSNGGVFRSTDNGNSWAAVNTGLTSTFVYTLAINSNGDIFAGTSIGGVFRSIDNGDSWAAVSTGLASTSVLAFAINSNGDIFAGTNGDGILRSTDNGNSWMAVNTGLTSTSVYALAINSNGDIFAVTSDIDSDIGIDIGIGSRVFRSTDNGNTWISVITGLIYVNSLSINLTGHIFAGTYCGVFRSTDNGSIWTPVNTGLANISVGSLAINTIGDIFAGTGCGVFRSTDNGSIWMPVNKGLTNPFVRSLVSNATGHVFAGTIGGGVFRSIDNGDTWTSVGLTNTIVWALAINAAGHIFAGTLIFGIGSRGGVFRSMDNGNTWVPVNTGLTNTSVEALAINAIGHIFVGTTEGGIFRSTDNGNTWMSVSTGLTNTSVRALAINASGHIGAGTAGGGVFRSTDNGNSWAQIGFVDNTVISLVINDGIFFVGTEVNGVFCSTDNGKTWTQVNKGLINTRINSFAISLDGHVWVGTDHGRIFQSIDSASPAIIHTCPSPQPDGQAFLIEANVTDDTRIANVILNYRRAGDPAFIPTAMTGIGDQYRGFIPASAVTSNGVEYYLVAADSFCNTTRLPSSGFFSVSMRVNSETKPTAQSNGNEKNAYRLISVPLQLDNPSPAAVLEDDLGEYNIKKWRLFDFVNGKYVEFPHAGAFTLGHSLFLIVKNPNKIIDAGPGQSVKTDRDFPILLDPGHNYIASPFNFNILPKNLYLAKGGAISLWTYSGEWIRADSLAPWEGYYLANIHSTPDTLFVNPDLSQGSFLQKVNKTNAGDWRLQIIATCGEARDMQNFAGIAQKSDDGWDENDLVEAPPIGEYISLYFPHPEWQNVLSRYSSDIRSLKASNQRWDFAIESNITGEIITLRFDRLQEIASELSIFLIDFELGQKQNLRENATYQFRAHRPDRPKELALIVGKEAFIVEQTVSLAGVPSDFLVFQNFPNPFNPTTTIRYGLPQAERVSLRVYNLLGEEVVTLINNEHKIAGYHVAIWDGRNKAGQPVTSGVYFYHFQAGDFSIIKKAALTK